MSNDKDTKSWQKYDAKRKEESLKNQDPLRARGRNLAQHKVRPPAKSPSEGKGSALKALLEEKANRESSNKTHAEKINPSKAAKDPRIQALKEQSQKQLNVKQKTDASLKASTSLTSPDKARDNLDKAIKGKSLQAKAQELVKNVKAKEEAQSKSSPTVQKNEKGLQAKAQALKNSKISIEQPSKKAPEKGKEK